MAIFVYAIKHIPILGQYLSKQFQGLYKRRHKLVSILSKHEKEIKVFFQ